MIVDLLVGDAIAKIHPYVFITQARRHFQLSTRQTHAVADVNRHRLGVQGPVAYLSIGAAGQIPAVYIELRILTQVAGAHYHRMVTPPHRQPRFGANDLISAWRVRHLRGRHRGVGPVRASAQVLTEIEGPVGVMGKIAPGELDVVTRGVNPLEGAPRHIRVIGVIWALGLSAILPVGPGAQSTRQLGVHVIVLQLGLESVFVIEKVIRIKDYIVDLGIAVLAKAVTAFDVSLNLQGQLVVHVATATEVGVRKRIAALLGDSDSLTQGTTSFERDRAGRQIEYATHVVGTIVDSRATAHHVRRLQTVQRDRKQRYANVTVRADGNRVAVHENLQTLRAQRVEAPDANIGENTGTGFVQHLDTRRRTQRVLQIQSTAFVQIFRVNHRSRPGVGFLLLVVRRVQPVPRNDYRVKVSGGRRLSRHSHWHSEQQHQ